MPEQDDADMPFYGCLAGCVFSIVIWALLFVGFLPLII